MPPTELFDWLARVGFTGSLFFVLYGSAKRWFYWAWQCDEMQAELKARITELKAENAKLTEDLEEERALARQRASLSERVVGVAETTARRRGGA